MKLIEATLAKIKSRFLAYDSKINWIVFCFIFCFTIGAWLDINGLWCELPIMVAELPEGWRLPSILSASTQIAQIAPFTYLIGRRFAPKVFTYVNVIYVILSIGALSCFLLSFFWNKTAVIFSQKHSIGLIVLNFCLALLDGTSSVTFLPYIGTNFVKEYIIPNYIGESLAALIPSILALIQGLGQDPGCHNVTDPLTNKTSLEAIQIKPNFSVRLYFLFMFGLLCISTIAFTLLNFSPIAKRERKSAKISKRSRTVSEKSELEISPENAINSQTNLTSTDQQKPVASPVPVETNRREQVFLLTIIFWVSFLAYGTLPGLQSYSTLPYGNNIFNYAVNLSFVFLPFSIIFSIWSYEASVRQIAIEFCIVLAFTFYIIFLSISSPCPPFLGSWLGPFLTVFSWIITQMMYMRIRCLVAARLERFGTLTMVGQIFGGLIIFIVVNVRQH
ncbi:solute carrier family riboflavin member 3-A [Brachionus plicatilis]|uniref:Riboflavin transporter n=1 Tax=Brachionus plicatilis TaxID=10195 RepID=A0A3M7QDX8_BRAPC|nr:solute carrier family riboflavin member 3-A [Brachionus plicatilis]